MSQLPLEKLEDLIGRVPSPPEDRDALTAMRDSAPVARRLAKRLHTHDAWRRLPLRELLPGLSLADAALFRVGFDVRAVNALTRADVRSWVALGDLTPEDLPLLPGIGVEALEEILLGAVREWAAAYLDAAGQIGEQVPVGRSRQKRLLRLIGRAPDPLADGELLSVLRDTGDLDAQWLAERLHADSELRHSPLRELMPGLGLVESPHFAIRLSVRAANCLARADAGTLTALAGQTPAEILALPDVGLKTGEEILLAVADEWAASYQASGDDRTPGEEVRNSKRAGSSGQAEGNKVTELANAFGELERAGGFHAYRRRQLDPDHPSQSKVAEELDVSGSRISQNERAIRALLSRRMRDDAWPISSAVAEMREQLGSVALSRELEAVLEVLDPTGAVLSDDLLHRRALLLQLSGYRISGEWVLGPDIELLTMAVLAGLTESGRADLDFVGRHLARLEIRRVLQVPWIISQPGFQVVDGEILRHQEK